MKILISFFFLVASVFAYSTPISEPTQDEAYQKLKSVLAKQVGPYNERRIQRVGDKTIFFEAFISMEADQKLGSIILKDFKSLPVWSIKNINNKPGGGTYYVKVQKMEIDAKDQNLLHGYFNVDVPLFKTALHGIFKLAAEENKEKGVMKVSGRMVQDPESILEKADAVLWSFPTEKPSPYRWTYVYALVKIKNWLLYEAFPERLLKRESGERIQIVLDNYQAEEDRIRPK